MNELEKKELEKILYEAVEYALDQLGDKIHELSIFCTVEEKGELQFR